MKNFITFENISKWSDNKTGLYHIILISLLIKSFFFISDSVVNKDGLIYIFAAKKFASGHFEEWLSAFPMPFYPFLIAMFHFLIPDWVAAARITSILFIVFAIIPIYLLTKELFDRNAAFWACLAFAVAPVPNSLADSVIRDPGFIFSMAWTVYFALRSMQAPRAFFLVMTAVFSLISILFRIEGIIFIIFSPIYISALYFIVEQNKINLLKKSVPVIMIPLFLISVFFIFGWKDTVSFNRSHEIYSEFNNFFKMGFLDNYYALSDQLITLENSSPVSGLKNNFAEIARHYIPVIYLFGIFETFVVVLFPLFLLPLFFSFKGPVQINRVFVTCVFWLYILIGYYFLIKMDFITSRYLAVPVLLIYPWVGKGMHRLFGYLSEKLSQKVFAALFLLFFIIPVYQCFEQEWKEDKSLIAAAKWIVNNSNTGKLKIITTDNRFLLYAGRDYDVGDASLGTNGDAFYSLDDKISSYNGLEQLAIQNKFDLVLLRISEKNEAPHFEYFKKLKEFKGRKNISYVFSSPEAAEILKDKI